VLELPPPGIKYLTQIFNAAMLTGYFPAQRKVAKIIFYLKPGKPLNELMSYRPISLLPILSEVYEKLFVHRLLPIIENRRLLPDHQFGFRKRHSTIHQTHRIVHEINEAPETKHTAPQPSWISPKLSTESGTLGSYTSYDNFSPSIITSFSNPICITDISKSRLKILTQTS
jgi:hypothetical protein